MLSRVSSTRGRGDKIYKVLVGSQEERDNSEDRGEDGRM
jgi:hypothetical protein